MKATISLPRVWHEARSPRTLLLGSAFLGISLLAGTVVANQSILRYALTLCLGLLVVTAGLRAPTAMLYGMVVWLLALGLTRRLVSHGGAAATATDPLLLTAPLAMILLLVIAARRPEFRARTRFGNVMLALVGLVILGALNPVQGSIFAGLSSLIFFIPLAMFWVGRTLPDHVLRKLLTIYGTLAVVTALYGLFQVTSGFPSWDEAWIQNSGYGALQVLGAIRPFSTFSSASEFAVSLTIAIVVWLILLRRRFRFLALAVVGLLCYAVFLQSSRGSIVIMVVALALLLGARRRINLPLAICLGLALLSLLPVVVRQFTPTTVSSSTQAQLTQHQLQGLGNPFDAKQSTAGAHVRMIVLGIADAVRNPAGSGLSSVTIAGRKFGGGNYNSEADPSNVAIALGLPGFLVYLTMLFMAIGGVYKLALRRRDPLALTVLGILIVVFPQWLNGGQYAVAFMPWLLLGWADATALRERTAARAAEEEAQEAAESEVAAVAPAMRSQLVRPPLVLPWPLPSEPAADEQAVGAVPEPEPEPEIDPVPHLPAAHTTADEPLPLLPDLGDLGESLLRTLPLRVPSARHLSIWAIEHAVAHADELDPERRLELQWLTHYLRTHATPDGSLPSSFADLVEDEFGGLLGRREG